MMTLVCYYMFWEDLQYDVHFVIIYDNITTKSNFRTRDTFKHIINTPSQKSIVMLKLLSNSNLRASITNVVDPEICYV